MRDQDIIEIIGKHSLPSNVADRYFRPESQFANLGDFRSRVRGLIQIPGLEAWGTRFASNEVFSSDLAEIKTSAGYASLFKSLALSFAEQVEGINALSKARVGQQAETSVFVKLPSSDSLAHITDFLGRLDKALSQLIYHPKVNGKFSVRSWETGSLWLEIFFPAASLLTLVAAVGWAAAVIRRKIIEGDAVGEHVRHLKLNNDARQQLVAAQEQLINGALEIEAMNIIDQYLDGDPDPETLPRIVHVIREFNEMIARGAEIHPALAAPEDVKNLFPPLASLLTLQSKVPELAQNREGGSAHTAQSE